MDVFLQDPVVDWVQSCTQKRLETKTKEHVSVEVSSLTSHSVIYNAEAEEDGIFGNDDEDGPSWEPARRVRNASRKLQGFNPIDIMLDDLEQNKVVSTSKSKSALEAILRGQIISPSKKGRSKDTRVTVCSPPFYSPERCSRSHLQNSNLEVADQVACLIDLALDPNVIGRQWQGLAMWL